MSVKPITKLDNYSRACAEVTTALKPITRPSSFFSSCTSVAKDVPPPMLDDFERLQAAMVVTYTTKDVEKLLKEFTEKHPILLVTVGSSTGVYSLLVHDLVQYGQSRQVMELCVEIGGKTMLEVGDSLRKTPIFRADGIEALKRCTQLNANVNVLSDNWTVLEHFMQNARVDYHTGLNDRQKRGCVKHLLRMKACIQTNSPLSQHQRSALASVQTEFLGDIAKMKATIKLVEEILLPVLQPIILEYAYGEDSETPVYDARGNYVLDDVDDETEAYAYIKSIPK